MDEFEQERQNRHEPHGSYAQRPAQGAYDQPPPYGPYAAQRPTGGSYGQQPPPGYYAPRPIPPEVRRWNWGAFALNWIWGCGNGAYLTLLCLIPGFNVVWIFICGAKGGEWAWKSGKFKDLDTFLTTQRTWNIAGVIYFCVNIVPFVLLVVILLLGALPWGGYLVDNMGYSEYESWY